MDKKILAILISACLVIPLFSFLVSPANSTGPYTATSFPYPGDDWGWKMVGADLAHEMGETGEGVRIAVLDTGIDYNHPDLRDKMWDGIGYDFVNDHDDPMDNDGHGTHVAGIISSVAPDAELMALKVIEEEGGRWQEVNKAIRFARENGADIISMSFGGGSTPFARAFEIQMGFAYNEGILLVASAGNDGTDTKQYPAAYNSVAAISALNHEKEKASYSNYGDWIELTAPGGDSDKRVYSTIPDESYGNKMGTSMATPFVTGVAAIKMGANPTLSGRQVREKMWEQAVDLGDPDYFGHGLVNAYLAAGGEAPSYPEDLRGSSGNETADLYWNPSRFEGLAPINGYYIYRETSSEDQKRIAEVSENNFQFTDNNVSNEVMYTYQVTAYNSYGESTFSTAIDLTPRGSPVEPSKVRNLYVVSNETPIELRWDEPMDDGGSSIIKYNVYLDGELVGQPTETYFLDPDARGNVEYTVSATNDVGEGATPKPVLVSVVETVDDGAPEDDDSPFELLPIVNEIQSWLIVLFIGIMTGVIIIMVYIKTKKPKGPD